MVDVVVNWHQESCYNVQVRCWAQLQIPGFLLRALLGKLLHFRYNMLALAKYLAHLFFRTRISFFLIKNLIHESERILLYLPQETLAIEG